MLPVIQSLWIGDALSNLEKLCIQSFMDNGHEFHLYTYENIAGIPDGTTVKDANEILSKDLIFRRHGKITTFSDWFRYALIAERGDFWVDMDTVCIKPFDFSDEIVFGMGEKLRIMNSPIKCPPQHPMMVALENACRNHSEIQPWDDIADKKAKSKLRRKGKENIPTLLWGPDYLAKAIRHYELLDHVKPFFVFFTADHSNSAYWFDNSFKNGISFYPDTYCLHFYNSVLAKMPGVDKNANYPAESAFEQLKIKHNIPRCPNAATVTHDQVHAVFAQATANKLNQKRQRQKKRKISYLLIIAVVAIVGFAISALKL